MVLSFPADRGRATPYAAFGVPQDIPTIEDRLRAANIPWSYYAATSTQPGYVWSSFSSIKPVFYGKAWKRHVFPVDQVTREVVADLSAADDEDVGRRALVHVFGPPAPATASARLTPSTK